MFSMWSFFIKKKKKVTPYLRKCMSLEMMQVVNQLNLGVFMGRVGQFAGLPFHCVMVGLLFLN